MRIAVGADHGGYLLKSEIVKHLNNRGFEVIDFGVFTKDSVDYPDIAVKAANAVAEGKAKLGILVCGTGIGMSITANKIKGIRCALVSDTFSAKATREHNNANMMALGERVIGTGLALELVDAFLDTEFSNEERHLRRISKISELEK